MRSNHLGLVTIGLVAFLAAACSSGSQGPAGAPGTAGAAGAEGPTGPGGPAGNAGPAGAAADASAPTPPSSTVASLQLPGDDFFPYAVNASQDGSIFVGSPATGEVVKFAKGSLTPTTIIAKANPVAGVNGLLVDDSTGTLYACTNTFGAPNFGSPMASVRSFDLDGNPKKVYALPNQGSGLCEDLAFDASHNLYVTDAFVGGVYVMKTSATDFVPWTTDALLKPTSPKAIPFGARGVVVIGSDMYLTNFNTGAFVHVPIKGDGSAGAATQVTVTPPLTNPETIRLLDGNKLVVAEDVWQSPNGLLSKLTVSGDTATKSVIANNLLGPTSVVVTGGNIWVPIGEVWHAIDQTPPTSLPFTVNRYVAE